MNYNKRLFIIINFSQLTDLEASNLKLIEENTNLKKNRKASTSSEEDIKNEKFIPRKSMI